MPEFTPNTAIYSKSWMFPLVLLDSSYIYYLCTYLKQWRTTNCFIMRDNSRRWRIVQKPVWLLNKAQKRKSFTTSFISQMKAVKIIKKRRRRSLWKRVQKPFNLSHLPLNNCKFPLGPMGEGLSVPPPPYLSPPYFAMLSGSLSTQPPASSRRGLWGSWAPGSAIVPAWGGKSGESSQLESGTIKKKEERKKEKKNLEPLLH